MIAIVTGWLWSWLIILFSTLKRLLGHSLSEAEARRLERAFVRGLYLTAALMAACFAVLEGVFFWLGMAGVAYTFIIGLRTQIEFRKKPLYKD